MPTRPWKSGKSRIRDYSRRLHVATRILFDIMEHPRTGLGHPEPLVGGNDVTYSRHISAHDRIIYDIYDERITVLVIQAEDHYNDK